MARSRSLRCEARAKLNGFEFKAIPVTHPGVEQRSQWLSIRQDRPDYVLLWGWGVMNSTAIKEAAAVGYPRDKMIGVWWSGAEPDVTPAGRPGGGYKALLLQHPAGKFGVHADLEKFVIAKDKSAGKDTFAQVLYNRGLINSMLGVEAIRTAQEQVRQEAADRRAGTLGLREPQPLGGSPQGARLRRHAEADEVHLPGPSGRRSLPACISGTARSGRSSPTSTRRTSRSLPPWSRRRPPSTRRTRTSRRATAPRRASAAR